MKFYSMEKDETLAALDTSENGLSAKAAEERLAQNGKNQLEEGTKNPL